MKNLEDSRFILRSYEDIVYINCLLNEIFDISLFYKNKNPIMYVKIIFEVKA